MAKRKPVGVVFSKYYEDVRAEMIKAGYFATPKDAEMAKQQAEVMGMTAQESAAIAKTIQRQTFGRRNRRRAKSGVGRR